MRTNSFRGVIPVWLNDSQRSGDGFRKNCSAGNELFITTTLTHTQLLNPLNYVDYSKDVFDITSYT